MSAHSAAPPGGSGGGGFDTEDIGSGERDLQSIVPGRRRPIVTDASSNAEEAWAYFLGWLLLQRAGRNDDVSALAHYAFRGMCHARRGYSGRDLFDGLRGDWGGYGLGERSINTAIREFLEFLRKCSVGAA